MPESKYSAPAVKRALEIIELMTETEVGLTVTEISSRLDISVNSAFRILKELEQKQYITKDNSDTTYLLTAKLHYLGNRIGPRISIVQEATPTMRQLALETKETILFGKLDKNLETIVVKQIQSTQPIKFLSQVGGEYSSYCSAMGKCLLAYQSPEEIARYLDCTALEAKTDTTITDREKFYAELKMIQTVGYAMDYEESVKGLTCIAAPIISDGGDIEGSICISGVSFRMTKEKIEQYKISLLSLTRQLSERFCG